MTSTEGAIACENNRIKYKKLLLNIKLKQFNNSIFYGTLIVRARHDNPHGVVHVLIQFVDYTFDIK